VNDESNGERRTKRSCNELLDPRSALRSVESDKLCHLEKVREISNKVSTLEKGDNESLSSKFGSIT